MQPINGDYEAIWRALPFDLSFLDDAGQTQWLSCECEFDSHTEYLNLRFNIAGLPDMERSGIDCDNGFLDILMTARVCVWSVFKDIN